MSLPSSRKLKEMGSRRGPILAVFLAALVTACTQNPRSVIPPSTTSAIPSTTLPPADGRLTIGVLLPLGGPKASLAAPIAKGIELAVSDVNDAGGIRGERVAVIVRDEGVEQADGFRAYRELVEAGADAIIGPFSSKLALGLISQVVSTQRSMCSPAAHALTLGEVNDSGFLFRTVPSERLEATALAAMIAATGRQNHAILHPDDHYGRAWATALLEELENHGTRASTVTAYDASLATVTNAVTRTLGDRAPDSIAIIGRADEAGVVLGMLRAKGAGPARVRTFVTDSLRSRTLFSEIGKRHSEPGDRDRGRVGSRWTSDAGVEGTVRCTVPGGQPHLQRLRLRLPRCSLRWRPKRPVATTVSPSRRGWCRRAAAAPSVATFVSAVT